MEISLKTGNMNTQKYNQIFIHRAIPSGKCRIKKGFIDSMHDSNPNYTTSAVKVFMNRTTCSGALAFIGWLSPKFLHQFAIFMAKYKEGGSRLLRYDSMADISIGPEPCDIWVTCSTQ